MATSRSCIPSHLSITHVSTNYTVHITNTHVQIETIEIERRVINV